MTFNFKQTIAKWIFPFSQTIANSLFTFFSNDCKLHLEYVSKKNLNLVSVFQNLYIHIAEYYFASLRFPSNCLCLSNVCQISKKVCQLVVTKTVCTDVTKKFQMHVHYYYFFLSLHHKECNELSLNWIPKDYNQNTNTIHITKSYQIFEINIE